MHGQAIIKAGLVFLISLFILTLDAMASILKQEEKQQRPVTLQYPEMGKYYL